MKKTLLYFLLFPVLLSAQQYVRTAHGNQIWMVNTNGLDSTQLPGYDLTGNTFAPSLSVGIGGVRIIGLNSSGVVQTDNNGNLSTGDISQNRITDLANSLSGKQATIPTGTALQYIKGDLSLGTYTGYIINAQALTSSPVDAQTVYFGMLPKAPTATANISKIYVRQPGIITAVELYCYSGTAGTAEAWSIYIRVNNTTDYLIASVSSATNQRVFTNTALAVSISAGDYFEIKSVNPTWVTNPLTTIFAGYIKIN